MYDNSIRIGDSPFRHHKWLFKAVSLYLLRFEKTEAVGVWTFFFLHFLYTYMKENRKIPGGFLFSLEARETILLVLFLAMCIASIFLKNQRLIQNPLDCT